MSYREKCRREKCPIREECLMGRNVWGRNVWGRNVLGRNDFWGEMSYNRLNTQKHVGVVRTKAPGKSLTFQKITCSKTWKSLTSYRNCNLTLLQTSHVPLWPFFYSHKRKIGSCYQEKTDLLVLLFFVQNVQKRTFWFDISIFVQSISRSTCSHSWD